MERYLLNYLKENSDDPIVRKYIDYFKIELDWHTYAYGENLSKQYHREDRRTIRQKVIKQIQDLIALSSRSRSQVSDRRRLLTFFQFADEASYQALGFEMYSPLLFPIGRKHLVGDLQMFALDRLLYKIIRQYPFQQILNKKLFEQLENYSQALEKLYRDIYDLRGLLICTEQPFLSKYHIDIFRRMGRPSIMFDHGMPGFYTLDSGSRSDYLMVWGEQIRQNYIDVGYDPQRIKVVGSYKYRDVPRSLSLRNSWDDILVLPLASVYWHQHEWGDPHLSDRSLPVLYLYQVQRVLQRLGVKHVRVRPHPTVDKKWLARFLDPQFYTMDTLPLSESLAQATLAIGSTSSTMLEATMAGLNYLIYEPTENGLTMLGNKPVPPFDGTEPGIIVAKNENELENMLRDKYQNDYSFIHRYIQPLDLSIFKKIIK